MLKKTLISMAMVLLFVTVCLADDLLSGHWTGKIMDQYDVAFDFKADAAKLTGNVTGPDGTSNPISDGVIKADSIFFKMPGQSGDKLDVKGKLKGEVLSISFNVSGMDIACDLKKTASTR
jgi:hypothetical protein